MELTKQLGDLKIHVTNSIEKKFQLVNDRAHIWCTNCKGQGPILPHFSMSIFVVENIKLQQSLVTNVNRRIQNGQVYQIDNSNYNGNKN